jgi:hypothetical protein
MQNKPKFQKAKMVVSLVMTMTNNNEQRTTNCSKQTQSNPIYSELVEPTCSELVEPIANQPPHFQNFPQKPPIS